MPHTRDSGAPAARDLPAGITVALNVAKFREIVQATMGHRRLDLIGLAWESGLPYNRVREFLAAPAGEPDRPPSSAVLFALLAWQYPEAVGTLAVRRDPAAEEDAGDPDPLAA